VLTPDLVEAVVTRTIELARLEPDDHAQRRDRLTGEVARLAEEIGRLPRPSPPEAATYPRWWPR
jgi:hypothetical protein